MEKTIGECQYNTNTAEWIAAWVNDAADGMDEILYKTPSGEWFVNVPLTKYNRSYNNSETAGKRTLFGLTSDKTRQWLWIMGYGLCCKGIKHIHITI